MDQKVLKMYINTWSDNGGMPLYGLLQASYIWDKDTLGPSETPDTLRRSWLKYPLIRMEMLTWQLVIGSKSK